VLGRERGADQPIDRRTTDDLGVPSLMEFLGVRDSPHMLHEAFAKAADRSGAECPTAGQRHESVWNLPASVAYSLESTGLRLSGRQGRPSPKRRCTQKNRRAAASLAAAQGPREKLTYPVESTGPSRLPTGAWILSRGMYRLGRRVVPWNLPAPANSLDSSILQIARAGRFHS
jgi:hypothetical protein